jgi:hypothetical protein
VALLLTALQRKVLHDAPLFLITAAVQGTGKTTLARVIHVLLSGHDMPVMTLSADPVEAKKAFFSALLNSPELICFDNIADGTTLRHPVLGAATTSSILKDRVLGLSKDAVVPLNVPIVVTGNNISLDQDFLRRFLEVRLTSKSARPETRAFKHAAVVQHVRRNRDRWTAAALSVLMGDGAALPAASGFPSWDQGIRSKLLAVAKFDPVDSWNRIRSNSEDLSRMQAYMAGLADWKPNDEEFTVRELAAAIAEGIRNSFATMPLLAKAFAEYPPRSGGEWNVNRLRWVMKMLTERPVAGFQLQVRTLDGYSRYSVTKFSEET